MAKKIVWSPKALSTFKGIIEYLENVWSERQVKDFIIETDKVLTYVSKYPTLFRKTSKKNIHEVLVTKHNLLLYKIYPDRIHLIMFWDTRQNPKKKKIIF